MNNDLGGSQRFLIVRNFPNAFSDGDIVEFMNIFDPKTVEIVAPHRTVCAEFTDKRHARDVLAVLHQQQLGSNLLEAFVVTKPRNNGLSYAASTSAAESRRLEEATVEQSFGDALRQLYATSEDLDFSQPPPPHLRYEYPMINEAILANIVAAMKSSRKLYIQVLHLMNRMNLEPPFGCSDPSNRFERLLGAERRAVAVQTDDMEWEKFLQRKRKRIASDESELESSSEPDEKPAPLAAEQKQRRKTNARKMIKMANILPAAPSQARKMETIDAFEDQATLQSMAQIRIVAPAKLPTAEELPATTAAAGEVAEAEAAMATEGNEDAEIRVWTDSDLLERRLPPEQLRVFLADQQPGEPSNRLYLKNLAKNVTEDDLKRIYWRYSEANCNGIGRIRSVDIRLMQTGRMKGQAFITFDGPYFDLQSDECRRIIETALRETNGILLRDKPIVVSYGRKKT